MASNRSRHLPLPKAPPAKSAVFRAFRLNFIALLPIGVLFLITLLTWGIAEYSTLTFQSKIEGELRSVIASDLSVSSRIFPSQETRSALREVAEKYHAKISESVEFPYTLDLHTSKTATGSRFLTTEVRILDVNYPLYGNLSQSGSWNSGAVVESTLYPLLSASGFSIAGKKIPVTGDLIQAPGVTQNPFMPNQTILIPEKYLPFETITASGAGFRINYEMDFAVSPESKQALLDELEKTFGAETKSPFRIQEQRTNGGNLTEIANTLNDFLWSILYASALIALASFIVTFSRFAMERKKAVRILLWMGLSESTLIRQILMRMFIFFKLIGVACILGFAYLPTVSLSLILKGGFFIALATSISGLILVEILFQDTNIFRQHKTQIRALFGGMLLILFAGYLWFSGGSYLPLLYAIFAILVLERCSWLLFWVASKIVTRYKNYSKTKFFLLDAFRSFQSAPLLGKISFSVFFLLSAALSAVFLFALTFQGVLRTSADGRINMVAINLLPNDYEKISKWIPASDFFATLRARIITINGKTLSEHLATPVVSREFSREFSITDGETDNLIVSGKKATESWEISIDEDFSKRIGIKIGDTVAFALSGRNFDFTVVWVRESKRSGVTPFFYFQIPLNAIPNAPKNYFLATSVTTDTDAWKQRVIGESGSHVSFIDVWVILEQVRTYSRLVLQWVSALFGYIAIIGLLAFLTAERTFFLLKIKKIQLYRLLGCSQKDGFRLLFFESVLGNMIPILLGSISGIIGLAIFLQESSLLKITPKIAATAFGVLFVGFILAYQYAQYSVKEQIKKTEPRIGGGE